ncbi:hypothetical protein GCM10009858_46920 [Terrabacter carboxydivorans]|uniref:Uncharacterized protein n=1 Tax=Terrabacter carboxydivorans TaxID=619730 RepID=A0ABP5ZUF3_9MICO
MTGVAAAPLAEVDGTAELPALLLLETDGFDVVVAMDVEAATSELEVPQAAKHRARAGTAARSVILRVMVASRSSGHLKDRTMKFVTGA